MEVSEKGLSLIKEFEGLELSPYKCPAGKNTIGYGHVINSDVALQQITPQEAEKLLRQDSYVVSAYLRSVINTHISISQGQFDALCSLVFNWGYKSFGRSKGLKELTMGNYRLAAKEFFSKDKGVVNIKGTFSRGLYRRRQAELRLWNAKA